MLSTNNVQIHILKGSGALIKDAEFISTQLSGHLKTIDSFLPVNDIDIIVRHNPAMVIPETGEVGSCRDPHLINITIDANRPDFLNIVRHRLLGTLAHEYHHALRWRGPGYGLTLGAAIISEGLACHFEQEVTGKLQPYMQALSGFELQRYLTEVGTAWNIAPYNHSLWFYNKTGSGVPRWTGYAVGYEIVNRYLKKHPGERASQLYNLSADAFLSFVDFDANTVQ